MRAAAAPMLAFTAPGGLRPERRAPAQRTCRGRGRLLRAVVGSGRGTARVPQPAGDPGARTAGARDFLREPFSWTEQWYAVAFEADIRDGTPHAVTLFDTDLVLFRASAGRYTALRDRCAHRVAPLSAGRVVGGTAGGCAELECRYHGWRFAASGACTHVPQNPPGAAVPRNASVRAYPAAAELGIVFVWLGAPGAAADAATIPLPRFVRALPEHARVVSRSCLVMLPYSYESLVENISDPGHVNFAHHGTTVVRRGKPVGDNAGYQARVECRARGVVSTSWGRTVVEWTPPNMVFYDTTMQGFGRVTMLFHLSPAGRGQARFMLTHVVSEAAPAVMEKFRSQPRWRGHIHTMDVLDGDTELLRGVDRVLGRAENWRKEFGPAAGQADRGPTKFRQWMDVHRADMPWLSEEGEVLGRERMSVAEMNNRLKNHTENCVSCTAALQDLERSKRLLGVVKNVAIMGVVNICILAPLVGAIPGYPWRALLTVGILLSGAILYSTRIERRWSALIEKLTLTDYSKKVFLEVE